MLYDSIHSFVKNDRCKEIGDNVDRKLERQRDGALEGSLLVANILPTVQGAALHRDDKVNGLSSDSVSDLQNIMFKGHFKCYRHQMVIFF